MRKSIYITASLIIGIVVVGRYIRPSDERKFSEFNLACSTASEEIHQIKSSKSIAIEYLPVSGVIEKDYYPTDLAKQLLTNPKRFEMVQLLFNSDDLSKTRPKSEDYCYGRFVISATQEDQLRIGLCGRDGDVIYKWEKQGASNVSQYIIRYKYGERSKYDIRPVKFYIEDSSTGQTIAEQNSFQLLLGKMKEPKNRVWLGWGAAEGARNCDLTDPKSFVTKAVQPLAQP